MGKDSSAIPDQVTASGLRRAELAASEDVVAAASVGKVKTGGQVADDWVDEKEVRRHTGEEKRFHDRVDAAHGERKVHGTPSAKAAEVLESKDRRPGFGVESPAGSARSGARNAVGVYAHHRSYYGGHSKVENVDADVAAERREFEEQEAGLGPADVTAEREE